MHAAFSCSTVKKSQEAWWCNGCYNSRMSFGSRHPRLWRRPWCYLLHKQVYGYFKFASWIVHFLFFLFNPITFLPVPFSSWTPKHGKSLWNVIYILGVTADIYIYFKFKGCHLGFSTSEFFSIGPITLQLVSFRSWTTKTEASTSECQCLLCVRAEI